MASRIKPRICIPMAAKACTYNGVYDHRCGYCHMLRWGRTVAGIDIVGVGTDSLQY